MEKIHRVKVGVVKTGSMFMRVLFARIINLRIKWMYASKILMGDFNLDLIKVDTHNQTKDFVHSLYTNAFYPTISKPTRVTDHSATLLDNRITNITGYCIKSGVLYNDISDHFPVFNLIKINSKITQKYAYIFKRMNTANNIEKLNSELKNANWDDVFADENPDSAYDTFFKYTDTID